MVKVKKSPFGAVCGRESYLYTVENEKLSVSFCDYGCTLTRLVFKGKNGVSHDCAIGYGRPSEYASGTSFIGATVGRYAGRIANARFSLNGKEYLLSKNDGGNHLHGGFGKRFWSAEQIESGVRFSLISPDGDEGFPGELKVSVTAELDGYVLRLTYEAESAADTVVNLPNHTYFNLSGGDVCDHYLRIYSARYAELGEGMIPTGRMLPVKGTPLDFTNERRIGEALSSSSLYDAGGIDHSFILGTNALHNAAEISCTENNLRILCRTTQPSVHIYTANFLQDDAVGKDRNGMPLKQYGGICLETQHLPDSPNKSCFPSTILRKGERYREVTEFEISHDDQ